MAQFEFMMNMPTLNNVKDWKIFRTKFEINVSAVNIDEGRKSAMLLFAMGNGVELLEPLNVSTATNFKELLKKFDKHFLSKVNLYFERFVFFNTKMNSEQKYVDYIAELQNKAKNCAFENLKDSLIVTQLICGISNDILREKLLQEKDLDLTNMCKIFECNKVHVQIMKQGMLLNNVNDETVNIDLVKKDFHSNGHKKITNMKIIKDLTEY